MNILSSLQEIQECTQKLRMAGQKIALVPTMGYFHEGHLSLMRFAKGLADKVVVSLFVNHIQFGPKEDLASYPRNFERDAEMAHDLLDDGLVRTAVIFADICEIVGHAVSFEIPGCRRHGGCRTAMFFLRRRQVKR